MFLTSTKAEIALLGEVMSILYLTNKEGIPIPYIEPFDILYRNVKFPAEQAVRVIYRPDFLISGSIFFEAKATTNRHNVNLQLNWAFGKIFYGRGTAGLLGYIAAKKSTYGGISCYLTTPKSKLIVLWLYY